MYQAVTAHYKANIITPRKARARAWALWWTSRIFASSADNHGVFRTLARLASASPSTFIVGGILKHYSSETSCGRSLRSRSSSLIHKITLAIYQRDEWNKQWLFWLMYREFINYNVRATCFLHQWKEFLKTPSSELSRQCVQTSCDESILYKSVYQIRAFLSSKYFHRKTSSIGLHIHILHIASSLLKTH
jgi:hypothetical protein